MKREQNNNLEGWFLVAHWMRSRSPVSTSRAGIMLKTVLPHNYYICQNRYSIIRTDAYQVVDT